MKSLDTFWLEPRATELHGCTMNCLCVFTYCWISNSWTLQHDTAIHSVQNWFTKFTTPICLSHNPSAVRPTYSRSVINTIMQLNAVVFGETFIHLFYFVLYAHVFTFIRFLNDYRAL